MAEIFGVVTGVLSVAALFNNVIQCFEYIQLGRNFGTDYQTCQLRLDIARLRLSRWGAAVDINNDARFAEINPSDDLLRTAKRTVEQLLLLLGRAYAESCDFQKTAKTEELALFDPNTNSNQTIVTLRNTIHKLARKRQERSGLSTKIAWALYKQKSFARLIEDIKGLLDDLEGIFPRPEIYKQIVEAEVAEVRDEVSLRVLSEASQETDDLLRTAAIRRLEDIGSSNAIDSVKVQGTAMVKVGNEYVSQADLYRSAGPVANKIGDLDASGDSRIHVGNSYGGRAFGYR